MTKVIKVARQGISADSTDPNDFIFHSSYNTFKIIASAKLSTQAVSADPTTITVAHGQGRMPGVYAFALFPDGYVALPNQKSRDAPDPVDRYWQVEVDSTNIYFMFYKGARANYNVDIRYYIFETPL